LTTQTKGILTTRTALSSLSKEKVRGNNPSPQEKNFLKKFSKTPLTNRQVYDIIKEQ
jgi:hypothetical protein